MSVRACVCVSERASRHLSPLLASAATFIWVRHGHSPQSQRSVRIAIAIAIGSCLGAHLFENNYECKNKTRIKQISIPLMRMQIKDLLDLQY